MKQYKIGEVFGLTSLTTRTIRYYEELGLLGRRENRLQGQSRSFDEEDVKRLKKIQALKGLGLSLEEIGQVIDLYFTDDQLIQGKQRVIEILKSHLASTEEKLNELNSFKAEIEANIAKLEGIITKYRDGEEK